MAFAMRAGRLTWTPPPQNPSFGLSDNGSVTSASILHAGTYTGTISVSVQVLVAQASTIKEISSNVNSARFAKSVSLSVQVSGVDPSRTVQFFNGTTSLGTAALSTSPSGGNSLKLATLTLTSLPVGSLNLTSRYPGDTNNAASTSQILAQSVIAADTKVTVSPASNPVSIGSSKFNISVQAVALGGGVPPPGLGHDECGCSELRCELDRRQRQLQPKFGSCGLCRNYRQLRANW